VNQQNAELVGRERRVHERTELEVHVSIDSFSQVYAGLSGNISTGGLFVATWHELQVGRAVSLRIVLPDEVVDAEGTVRWRRGPSDDAPPGFGIAFTALEPSAAEAIEAFCSARPPLYHDSAD
jgi:uncharacterized protein (TIGR02266 family)